MGSKFDDYVAETNARLSADGRALSAAFEAHLEIENRVRFTIPQALCEARKAAGLNQQELAEISGVHQSEISRIERGQGNPTLETIERLAGPLNVHLALVDSAGRPLQVAP